MRNIRVYRDRRRSGAPYFAVALVVVLAGWLGYRAWTVERELTLARQEISAVQSAAHGIVAGRGPGDISVLLSAPARHAARARAAAHDPLFRAVGVVPWLGRPLRTATGVADAAADLTRTTLPALADAAGYWKIVYDSKLSQGVPIDFIAKASGPLDRAVAGLQQASERLARLPEWTWMGQVDDARILLAEQVTTLLDDVRVAAAVAGLAPDMLGRDGVRHYLVAFQNRAEARGTGGLLGALALVEARAGHLRVLRYISNQELHPLSSVPAGFHSDLATDSPVLGVGTLWQNSNYGPDFADAGAAWAAMYTATYHVPVDGVLALDPDGLASLMAVTGPASVQVPGRPDVRVDSTTVADFVERGQYQLPVPRDARKSIQRQLAQTVLDRLFGMDTPPLSLVDSLTRAARLQHVLLMSRHSQEERRLASWPLSGLLSTGPAPFAELVVNNATGSKLDYYLRTSMRYTVTDCANPRRVRITVTLENGAPAGLPAAVGRHDDPLYPVGPQQDRDLVAVYATQGARLLHATLEDRPVGTDPSNAAPADGLFLREGVDHGHPVWTVPLELAPNQPQRLVLDLAEPASQAEPLMPVQPMTNPTAVSSDLDACRRG